MIYKDNKALFLDRDGVINKDFGHVYRIEDFEFIEGIFELCELAILKGFLIIIITNQAGIGKSYYSDEDFQNLNNWMVKKFKEKNITITKVYYCPHRPEENCTCRKPNPGMIIKAIEDYSIDTSKSILIGDKTSDIIAGERAKIKNTFLFKGYSHKQTIKYLDSME
jgi:D-glycero-D-manno-heptose 1,7-bisphosphate phosphatase